MLLGLSPQAYGIVGTIMAALVAGGFAAATGRRAARQADRAVAATTEVTMVAETWEQTKALLVAYREENIRQRALVDACERKCVEAVARADLAIAELAVMRRAVIISEQQTEVLRELRAEIIELKSDLVAIKGDRTDLRAEVASLRKPRP